MLLFMFFLTMISNLLSSLFAKFKNAKDFYLSVNLSSSMSYNNQNAKAANEAVSIVFDRLNACDFTFLKGFFEKEDEFSPFRGVLLETIRFIKISIAPITEEMFENLMRNVDVLLDDQFGYEIIDPWKIDAHDVEKSTQQFDEDCVEMIKSWKVVIVHYFAHKIMKTNNADQLIALFDKFKDKTVKFTHLAIMSGSDVQQFSSYIDLDDRSKHTNEQIQQINSSFIRYALRMFEYAGWIKDGKMINISNKYEMYCLLDWANQGKKYGINDFIDIANKTLQEKIDGNEEYLAELREYESVKKHLDTLDYLDEYFG